MSDKQDGKMVEGIGLSFGMNTGEAGKDDEAVERPVFRIVVIAEATARHDYSTGPAPGAQLLPVTRNAFDDVMRTLSPALAIEVANVFDPSGKPLKLELRWENYKSLKPQGIVDQVPVLRGLVDARRTLERVVQKQLSVDRARDELGRLLPQGRFLDQILRELAGGGAAASPEAAPAAKTGHAIDSLLDKVDLAAPKEPSALSSVIAGVARSAKSAEQDVPGEIVTRLEDCFSKLLGSVLAHPEVRRLESVWRSLWALAAEAKERTGVELDLISVDESGVAKALVQAAQAAHRGPPDLLVLAATLDATHHDLELLEQWALAAEQLRAVLVADGTPKLLGYDKLEDLARSSVRISASTDPRAVLFKSFTAKDAARWVALCLNRPLARAAYTAESSRIRDMPFAEGAQGDVYMYAGFSLAALAARSFVRFGVASALTGSEHGKIANLPVHDYDHHGSVYAIPVECFIPSETQGEIARAGLVALGSARNHDAALVTGAPVSYRGEGVAKGGDAPAAIGVGDQLFVGRFSYMVEQLAAAMPRSGSPDVLAETARVVLHGFFAVAPPAGPELDARVVGNSALEVTVRPRRYAGITLQEVTLSAPLGDG